MHLRVLWLLSHWWVDTPHIHANAVRVIPWHWRVWCSSLRECYTEARFYLASPMCDLYIERYIGVSCTGLNVELGVLWEVHSPLDLCFDVIEESSSSLWLKEAKRQTNKTRKEGLQDHGAVCAVSGSCLVQLPRSFIDSLLKAVPRWYIEGQSVVRVLAILTIYIATTTLIPSGFAVEPVNSIWLESCVENVDWTVVIDSVVLPRRCKPKLPCQDWPSPKFKIFWAIW